jgi:hypothetical protein
MHLIPFMFFETHYIFFMEKIPPIRTELDLLLRGEQLATGIIYKNDYG